MIEQILAGNFTREELPLRYKFILLRKNGAIIAAKDLLLELLDNNPNDGLLHGYYYSLMLETDRMDEARMEFSGFLSSDIGEDEIVLAMRVILHEESAINATDLVTLFVYRFYGLADISGVSYSTYRPVVDSLALSGYISVASDMLHRLGDFAQSADEVLSSASVLEMTGNFVESPMHTLKAMMLQWFRRYDMKELDEVTESGVGSSLIYAMGAWKELKADPVDWHYQFMTHEQREEIIARFVGIIDNFIRHPEDLNKEEAMLTVLKTTSLWYTETFPDSGDEEEEETASPGSALPSLPEFDDEEYLNCVDYVVENFTQFFPESEIDNKAFVLLLLLPVYAVGNRIGDFRRAVSGEDPDLVSVMQDMMEAVEILFGLTNAGDEVEKALRAIDVHEILIEHYDEEMAVEVIDVVLSTLRQEKKTLLKIMKEYRRGER